jgi:hypothetical protein
MFAFPTESWHTYQVQYKNSLADPVWQSLGAPISGNDTQQSVTDSTTGTNRFYRIIYQ